MKAKQPHDLESFSRLEDKIYRVAEAYRVLSKENSDLNEQVRNLGSQVDRLKKDIEIKEKLLDELRQDREQIKNRIKKILGMMTV